MKIKGRTVLVTGSNRGLGRTLVEQLLARGAKRVYAASRSGESSFADPRVVPITLDLTNQASIAAAAKQASDVELLVNNAGVFSAGPVLTATNEQLRGDMNVNYFGLVDTIRAFLPSLRRAPDAAIVNVLSVLSLANWSTFGGYAATKAASWSLTQALRVELPELRVHAAFPGLIDTEMVAGYPGAKASTAEVATGILDGLEAGELDIAPDSASRGFVATYHRDPRELIRAFAG